MRVQRWGMPAAMMSGWMLEPSELGDGMSVDGFERREAGVCGLTLVIWSSV